jgi:EAL domain-containing protein (putative c-di-GMP-specific phosphodiesterase class I)
MFDEFDRKVYAAGRHVFNAGDIGDCAYLIEEGKIEVLVGEVGHQRCVSVMGAGEMFGEIALIDQKPRTATVRALERTVLVPIQRTLVDDLLAKSDPILRHLLLVILERFRNQVTNTPSQNAFSPAQSKQRAVTKKEATRKLSLAHAISRALTREEFRLYYQPICDLKHGHIAGFEALIRWEHPVKGLISPLDFLPLAEQSKQIREIGLWTLDHACRDWMSLKTLTKVDQPFVSVNLSALQLTSSTLVKDVKAVMHKYTMPPKELKLELTETVMVEHPEAALKILNELIALGISLALDDYGTGHSGLDYLQRYPIGTMKIDRSFAAYVAKSSQSLEIVRSSITLAHSLGMNVVAEGIETEDVRAQLIAFNCEFGQGWLFDKASPLPDLMARYGQTK